MIVVILFIAFFAFVIYASAKANRQLQARRQGIVAQIDGLHTQLNGLYTQSRALDEATIARVDEARAAVEAKLNQARTLTAAATADRHFARVGRILAQVQTKLGNLQASIGRAQSRADARVQRQQEAEQRRTIAREQRQMEAEQRREAARMGKATLRTQRGSFAPPAQVTNAQTPWNTVPVNERGACFFCSRPCLLRELTPVTVPIGGNAQRVLACPQDLSAIRAGNLPPIRAFNMDGRRVPWYAYSRYNPYRDYYADHFDVDIYLNRYPFDIIEPMYWNFDAPYVYDDGPAYVFAPQAEAYQDYMSANAAGSVDFSQNVGGVDFAPADAGVGGATWGGMDFSGTDMQNVGGMDVSGGGDFAAGPDVS